MIRTFPIHRIFGVVLFILHVIFIQAQEPAGYYSNAYNRKTAELKTALYNIISPHTRLVYLALPSQFQKTDWDASANGYWDMYSNKRQGTWSGLNREHSMPKSWFGVASGSEDAYDISVDLHNLYPSDPAANTAKSNYALGVVGSGVIFTNGVTKVGSNSYPGYNGTVFEPANEYKGDFARTYMYMVTCYENYSSVWTSVGTLSMLQRNTYPVLNTYAVSLLMDWHRADPVSAKEINRNNEVYKFQHNRNPFVDHPLLAEYIWGKFVGSEWNGTSELPETDEPLRYYCDSEEFKLVVYLNNPAKAGYKIYNMSGELIREGNVSDDSRIDLKYYTGKHFEKGVYILSVYAGTFRKTVRFIVT